MPAKRLCETTAAGRPLKKLAVKAIMFCPCDDDTALLAYCKKAALRLSAPQQERLVLNLHRGLVMSTACTGSGMAEVVHAVLHNMTGASSECAFACEKVKFKREFVLSIVSPLLSKHGCMFEDMTTLPSGVSTCAAHRQACKVTRRTDNTRLWILLQGLVQVEWAAGPRREVEDLAQWLRLLGEDLRSRHELRQQGEAPCDDPRERG